MLRVPSNFHLTLARGVRLTCKQAAARMLASGRSWETRSAGKGSKGARWYAWAWLATISPRHYLLIRRHIATGELAFHYCHVPEGQPLSGTGWAGGAATKPAQPGTTSAPASPVTPDTP